MMATTEHQSTICLAVCAQTHETQTRSCISWYTCTSSQLEQSDASYTPSPVPFCKGDTFRKRLIARSWDEHLSGFPPWGRSLAATNSIMHARSVLQEMQCFHPRACRLRVELTRRMLNSRPCESAVQSGWSVVQMLASGLNATFLRPRFSLSLPYDLPSRFLVTLVSATPWRDVSYAASADERKITRCVVASLEFRFR